MTEEVSGPSPEEDDDGPQTNPGKDFLAGFMAAVDMYWGDVEKGDRISNEQLATGREAALRYEEFVALDPGRQEGK